MSHSAYEEDGDKHNAVAAVEDADAAAVAAAVAVVAAAVAVVAGGVVVDAAVATDGSREGKTDNWKMKWKLMTMEWK